MLRTARYHSYDPSELLSQQSSKFRKLINKLKQLAPSGFHIADLGDVIDDTYSARSSLSRKPFLEDLMNNLKNANLRWIGIYPLDFNIFLYPKFRGKIEYGKFLIISAHKNAKRLSTIFNNLFCAEKPNIALLEHYNRTYGGFLLSNPLLSFPLEGSIRIAKCKSNKYFKYFKAVHDLYLASFDKRKSLFPLRQYNAHFFLLNSKTGDIKRFSFREGTKIYGQFDISLLRKFRKLNLSYFANLIFGKPNKLFDRIYNSLHFFSKGFNEDDLLSRFIFYVIAMESLFSVDNIPLRTALADYISILCCEKPRRIEMHKKIKDIYDLRSEVVHSGRHTIHPDIVEETERIVAAAIMASLKLYPALIRKADPEKAFFTKLLEMKLGY